MAITEAPVTEVPGYIAGTWDIDTVHSEVSFVARHLMVSKVRGHFGSFEGVVVTDGNPLASTVEVSIDLSSIDTGNEQRDDHLRSADFFEVDAHKTVTYRSTGVRAEGDHYVLEGDLTLKGVTRSVPLAFELNGFNPDPWGGTRAGFSATGQLNRQDFGVSFNAALETGGVVVSDKVQLVIEAELVLRQPEA
jgi:polyisoprenoid-binding protein YceI